MSTWTPPEAMYASDPREGAAYGLFALMTGLSEGLYCAGWLIGLERSLWAATMQDKPFPFGQGEITYAQITLLRLLSEEAGGWRHWPEGADGPVFVALEDWRRIAGGDPC